MDSFVEVYKVKLPEGIRGEDLGLIMHRGQYILAPYGGRIKEDGAIVVLRDWERLSYLRWPSNENEVLSIVKRIVEG